MSDLGELEAVLFQAGKEGAFDALTLNPGGWGGNGIMPLTRYIPKFMKKYLGVEYKLHTIDSFIKKAAGYLGKEVEGTIFGTHKTIEGLALSLLGGALAGMAWYHVPGVAEHFGKDNMAYTIYNMKAGFLAAIGDLAGSYSKRRSNIEEGGYAPNRDSIPWMLLYPILYYYSKRQELGAQGLYKAGARVMTSAALSLGIGRCAHELTNRMAGKIKEEDVKRFKDRQTLYLPSGHIYNSNIQ